ncbi:hypothetical protein A0H76_232 [Hepatospora eriocheir]|uniref:mRNA-capping enzyme subunit beta n=1 Tax=Hepatospora eriocheir TaxID=1081669 RepID=A0A1X0QJ28_9MICR|nr:hypothetical protein A0H76_232 [Hepatospora eriocheir]
MFKIDSVEKRMNCTINEIIESILREYEMIDNLEVEVRLGYLIDKITHTRVELNVMLPIVYNSITPFYYFKSGVSQTDFQNYLSLFKSMTPTVYNDTVSINSSNIRKIKVKDSEDVIFEKKVRLKDITIYMPSNDYDLRISISREEIKEKIVPFTTNFIRERERKSFKMNDLTLDFTTVKNKGSKDAIYEIELEGRTKKYDIKNFINKAIEMSYKVKN